MRFSKSCSYAIQASLYLASTRDERRYVPIREISEQLGISYHFLTKILQSMSNQRILISYRGPHGGVGLARPASQISILDIITAVEKIDFFEECLMGLPGCGSSKPCPLHDSWERTRKKMMRTFETMSLGKLAGSVRRGTQRISGFEKDCSR